jgi:hypothetical protein
MYPAQRHNLSEKAVAAAPPNHLIAGAMLWTVLRNSKRDPSASGSPLAADADE